MNPELKHEIIQQLQILSMGFVLLCLTIWIILMVYKFRQQNKAEKREDKLRNYFVSKNHTEY